MTQPKTLKSLGPCRSTMLLFHLVLASLATVSAQQVDNNGCLRLLGSVACPGCTFLPFLHTRLKEEKALIFSLVRLRQSNQSFQCLPVL
jgi:hypothetical protein